jgi:hypothetical protein
MLGTAPAPTLSRWSNAWLRRTRRMKRGEVWRVRIPFARSYDTLRFQ